MAIVVPKKLDEITAEEFGAPVANQLNALVPTVWVAVTFVNGWANYAGYNTQYRKVGDVVYVRGGAVGPAIGTNIFVLPTGFRPPSVLQFASPSWSIVGVIQVDPSGAVFAQATVDPRFAGLTFSFSTTA